MASEKTPKFLSETDPAARYICAHNAPACYAYEVNYLIDTDHGVVVDVEATTAIRQAEVEAARRMLDRTEDRHGLQPRCLAADTAYGSGPILEWLVEEKGIEPHIPVFDKGERNDGTFSRSDSRMIRPRIIIPVRQASSCASSTEPTKPSVPA